MEISELKPVTKEYIRFELNKEDNTETTTKNLNFLMVFGNVIKFFKTENEQGNVYFKIIYYPNEQSDFESFEISALAYKLKNVSIILNDYENEVSKIIVPDGENSDGEIFERYYVTDDDRRTYLISTEDDLHEIK